MAASLYVAILLSQSSSDVTGYEPAYEETLLLIRASSLEDARQQAMKRGHDLSHQFTNALGQTISWHFRSLVDISPVFSEDLGEVTELSCRHFHDIDAYERFDPRSGIGEDL